ncbi:MAG: hypothetical protein R3C59_14820 [Planctomycetaceae bacterium]
MRTSPCWLLACIAVTPGLTTAQESSTNGSEDNQRRLWMTVYSEEAAEYEIFRSEDDVEKLQFIPRPVLTFTNPVRIRDTHGAVFLWTSDGRPEVIGAIWSVISPDDSTKRHLSHEFHSLSLAPIHSRHEPRMSRRGPVPDWSTRVAGIERQKIPGAKPPSGTKDSD